MCLQTLQEAPMTRIIYPLVAALALMAALCQSALAQTVDPASSELVFVTKQMGVPVEGHFQRWSAQVALDPKKPEQGQVVLRIQMDSVAFGAPEVTAEAQRPVWLDTAQYPQAVFQSTGIKPAGNDRYEMSGKLTLKGQSHDMVVPITLARNGGSGTASGNFTVKRNDFRIGEGEWTDPSLVALEVQVRFRIALSGLPTS
jgi:polyisoprenoid-binding protein YceI